MPLQMTLFSFVSHHTFKAVQAVQESSQQQQDASELCFISHAPSCASPCSRGLHDAYKHPHALVLQVTASLLLLAVQQAALAATEANDAAVLQQLLTANPNNPSLVTWSGTTPCSSSACRSKSGVPASLLDSVRRHGVTGTLSCLLLGQLKSLCYLAPPVVHC